MVQEAPIPEKIGKYTIVRRLGVGGMAEVFEAKAPGAAGFTKTVVVKRMLPHLTNQALFVEMFIREAKMAAAVQHRCVVQVFEFEQLESGDYCMVMEFVRGPDLRQMLAHAVQNKGRLPPWFSIHCIAEVLDGLDFAYNSVDDNGQPRRLIHRDVTPSNVFVSVQGEVKLGDFGVARDATFESETRTGQQKGKLAYMAPEQIMGNAVDGRLDVFSAGIVLWECLSQLRLFGGKVELEVMNAILKGQRKPPSSLRPDVPQEVDQIVLDALEPDPVKRIPSAKVFRQRLLEVLHKRHGTVLSEDVRKVVEVYLGKRPPDEVLEPQTGVRFMPEPGTGSSSSAGRAGQKETTGGRALLPPTEGSGPRTPPPPVAPDSMGLRMMPPPTSGTGSSPQPGVRAPPPHSSAFVREITQADLEPGLILAGPPAPRPPPPAPAPPPLPTPPRAPPLRNPTPARPPTPVAQGQAQYASRAVVAPLVVPSHNASPTPPPSQRAAALPAGVKVVVGGLAEPTHDFDSLVADAVGAPAAPAQKVQPPSRMEQRPEQWPRPPGPAVAQGQPVAAPSPMAPLPTGRPGQIPPALLERWGGFDIETPHAGAFPHFLRPSGHRPVGPLSYEQAQEIFRSEGAAGTAKQVWISGDGERWISLERYAEITGQQLYVRGEEQPIKAAAANQFGTTRSRSLTSLFAWMWRQKATGRFIVSLEARGKRDVRELEMVEGRPTGSFANSEALTLPQIMRSKKIVPEGLITELMWKTLMVDRTLLEVASAQLATNFDGARGLAARERWSDPFQWESATFGFDARGAPTGKPLANSLLGLLPSLVMKAYELSYLRQRLGSRLEVVIRSSSSFDQDVIDLGLGKPQLELLEPILKGRKLSQQLKMYPAQERALLPLVYLLGEVGAIE